MELLAVVATIVLLMAVLTPALNEVKKQARTPVIQSHLACEAARDGYG